MSEPSASAVDDERPDRALDGALDERLDRALMDLRRFWTAPAVVADGAGSVELSTLLVLEAVAGAPGGEVGIGLVGARLQVRPSTASRLVDRAVAAGVVAKGPSALSGRRASLTLTADGRVLAIRARDFRAARLAALLADWSAADRQALTGLLERLASAVRTEQTPA